MQFHSQIRPGLGQKFHRSSWVRFFPFRTSQVRLGQHKFSGHVGIEFLSIGSKKAIFKVIKYQKFRCTPNCIYYRKNCLCPCLEKFNGRFFEMKVKSGDTWFDKSGVRHPICRVNYFQFQVLFLAIKMYIMHLKVDTLPVYVMMLAKQVVSVLIVL